jgi:hypothetical protein
MIVRLKRAGFRRTCRTKRGTDRACDSATGRPFSGRVSRRSASRLNGLFIAAGTHVLLTRSLFACDILRRLLLRVSLAKSTSAPLRFDGCTERSLDSHLVGTHSREKHTAEPVQFGHHQRSPDLSTSASASFIASSASEVRSARCKTSAFSASKNGSSCIAPATR